MTFRIKKFGITLKLMTVWTKQAAMEFKQARLGLLKEYAASSGVKAAAVMWAVRVAIARQAVTPGGATELMEVFGKAETLSRIEQALAELQDTE